MEIFKDYTYRYLSSDSMTTCIIGHSFIRRLIIRWKKEHIPLPDWSFHAFGKGGMRLDTLLNIVRASDFTKYHSVFIQAGENDILSQSTSVTKRLILQIRDELLSQGVKVVLFGELFPRHHRGYNKSASLINRMLKKQHPDIIWEHENPLMSLASIQKRDATHLTFSAEADFSNSINRAIQHMRM